MSMVSILDKTICVHIACSLWAGTRSLRKDELTRKSGQLPPKDLLSLGDLKLCDPKRLTPLKSVKRAAERDCARRCARFLGGYGTDVNNLDGLMSQLAERKSEFEKRAKGFVTALPLEFEDWIARHANWEHVLRREPPDPNLVASRFTFEFHAYRVRAATDHAASAAQYGLVTAVSGLSAQLFGEIGRDANAIWRKSYEGKQAVGQKALRPIRTMRDKLNDLRFLDARIRPMIDQIDDVLNSLPRRGELAGRDYRVVAGLLGRLGDVEQLTRHAVCEPEHSKAGPIKRNGRRVVPRSAAAGDPDTS